jgi:hypothetical protein
MNLPIPLFLPAAVGPGVYSAPNRTEYQKNKKCLWGAERGRLKTSPPSVARLSRQCRILNILQPHRLSRAVTGIALLFLLYVARNVSVKECRDALSDLDPCFHYTTRSSLGQRKKNATGTAAGWWKKKAQINVRSFLERYAALNQKKQLSFTKWTLVTRNLIDKFRNAQATVISPGFLLNRTEM